MNLPLNPCIFICSSIGLIVLEVLDGITQEDLDGKNLILLDHDVTLEFRYRILS
jgi:hypothetical protein